MHEYREEQAPCTLVDPHHQHPVGQQLPCKQTQASKDHEEDQGEISGLSRSVSNLGSSLGVAIAGTVMVSSLVTGNAGYALALIVLAVFAVVGLVAAFMLPVVPVEAPKPEPSPA